MSTRSTVIYSDNTGNHIWEEMNEPVYSYGKFIGYNVHGVIDYDELKEVKSQDGGLLLTFVKDSFFHFLFPEGLKLSAYSLSEFEIDSSGFSFMIKGENQYMIKALKEAAKKDPSTKLLE